MSIPLFFKLALGDTLGKGIPLRATLGDTLGGQEWIQKVLGMEKSGHDWPRSKVLAGYDSRGHIDDSPIEPGHQLP